MILQSQSLNEYLKATHGKQAKAKRDRWYAKLGKEFVEWQRATPTAKVSAKEANARVRVCVSDAEQCTGVELR